MITILVTAFYYIRDFYFDPKLAVAAIIPYEDKIVMVKRAIEPGIGKWSFPSGYVNRYESLGSALKREVKEECSIDIDVGWVVGIYSEKNNPVVLIRNNWHLDHLSEEWPNIKLSNIKEQNNL